MHRSISFSDDSDKSDAEEEGMELFAWKREEDGEGLSEPASKVQLEIVIGREVDRKAPASEFDDM